MRRVWDIASWSVGIILIISLLAFSDDCQNDTTISHFEITIDEGAHTLFVLPEEIKSMLYEEYPQLDSLYCREINKNLLEETLENHPSIARAEVYSTLSGVLNIQLTQKRPMFRVQNSNRAYYIDDSGSEMPLSPHFSAKVPLVTGQITEENKPQLFELFSYLEEDEYYHNYFHGVDVDSNNNLTLYPATANHTVEFGTAELMETKLDKLKTFYGATEYTEYIKSVTSINLAINGQVICSKN